MDEDEETFPAHPAWGRKAGEARNILAALDADLPALPGVGVEDPAAIAMAIGLLEDSSEDFPDSA